MSSSMVTSEEHVELHEPHRRGRFFRGAIQRAVERIDAHVDVRRKEPKDRGCAAESGRVRIRPVVITPFARGFQVEALRRLGVDLQVADGTGRGWVGGQRRSRDVGPARNRTRSMGAYRANTPWAWRVRSSW